MPIYEYEAIDPAAGCAECRARFEKLQRMAEPALTACPACGAAVRRVFSAPAIGSSKSGFDDRAKSAGFHKLERRNKGEYEIKY